MSKHSINIIFTREQLGKILESNQTIAIAKSINGETPDVIWQTVAPLTQATTISWSERYGIYTGDYVLVNDVALNKMASVPIAASMDKLYVLNNDPEITGPSAGGEPGVFALNNKYTSQSSVVVGLYQDAKINGEPVDGNAISADSIGLYDTFKMPPSLSFYFGLIPAKIKTNRYVIIDQIQAEFTEIEFGVNDLDIYLTYDSENQKFIW